MTLARAVLAEWTKMRTLPSNVAAMAALTVLMTATAAVVTAVTDSPSRDITVLLRTGVHATQIAAVALAAAMLGAEFHPRLIRVTLAMQPRRRVVLAAKTLVLSATVLVTTLAGTVVTVLVAPALLGAETLGDPAVVETALYLALVALLTAGVTAAVRHAGTAIGLAVTALYGPYMIIVLVPMSPSLSDHIQDTAPMTAGLSALGTAPGGWSGLAVLAAYAVAALIAGAAVFKARDA
ncbi:hypothetical protein AB0M02_22085 [Actinoplanes sp. NPDC051861]|uniref:hypothetical protein n=1 Tax=Actinoplanes sp. NPDC051861 TaxID=3155170 RepID=UPI0034253EE5